MHNKNNNYYINNVQYCSRVPQGTCGLKLWLLRIRGRPISSGPARDLWIEIQYACGRTEDRTSGPARDLWIEIWHVLWILDGRQVGSRKGPVD